MICSFLRGLSARDVEAALEETFDEPVIWKSTVSRGRWRTPATATASGAADGSTSATACTWTGTRSI